MILTWLQIATSATVLIGAVAAVGALLRAIGTLTRDLRELQIAFNAHVADQTKHSDTSDLRNRVGRLEGRLMHGSE